MEPKGVLNGRERRMLQLCAEGKNNIEIGRELGYVDKSVYNALKRIYTKLGVPNRTAAACLAVKRGWISGPEVTS